jgi:hypothetical protein
LLSVKTEYVGASVNPEEWLDAVEEVDVESP